MFVFILILVSMGASMLWAAVGDHADGNRRDSRFLILLGSCTLVASGILAFIPVF